MGRKHGRRGWKPPSAPQGTHCVSSIQLQLLSSREVVRKSIGAVGTSLTTYDAMSLPTPGGVMDSRCGAEGQVACVTCLNTARSGNCHGHPGHMDLHVLALHPQMQQIVQHMLNSICFACGHARLPQIHHHKLEGLSTIQRLAVTRTKAKMRTPCRCGLPTQPVIADDGKLRFKASWVDHRLGDADPTSGGMRSEMLRVLDEFNDPATNLLVVRRLLDMALSVPTTEPLSIRRLLQLPDRLCADALVIDALRVSGKVSRPTHLSGGNRRELHALTRRTLFVASANENVRQLRELRRQWEAGEITAVQVKDALRRSASTKTARELLDELTEFNSMDVATQIVNLFDSSQAMPLRRRKRDGAANDVGSIKDFLGGKMGLIRRRTRGGRVLFSGRAPLGPSPASWPVDTVGLPLWMAVRLTVPLKVASFNLHAARDMVRAGFRARGGANRVENFNGEEVNIRTLDAAERDAVAQLLDVGWVVHRCLQDGDWVLVNRAPTLHAMNFMALKVRIVGTYAVRMNHLLAVCYNFDYDGDEVIVHVPQSALARADAAILMAATNYIMDTTIEEPIITPTLNTPLAVYLLTAPDLRLGKVVVDAMVAAAQTFFPDQDLVAKLVPPSSVVNGHPAWTGREVLAVLFPRTFWYGPVKQFAEATAGNDGVVAICNGMPRCGRWIGKRVFGGKDSITQALERDFGRSVAIAFLSGVVAMESVFLTMRGFSLGTADLMQPPEVQHAASVLRHRTRDALAWVAALDSKRANVEVALGDVANTFLDNAATLARAFPHRHLTMDSAMVMALSGAKGNERHVAQMRVGLGQQLQQGGRLFVTATGTCTAPAPCFQRDSKDPESRGLVMDAYGTVNGDAFPCGRLGRIGLSPHSAFAHSISGISAMCSTACGVPKTGTKQNAFAGGGEFTVIRGNGLVFTGRSVDKEGLVRGPETLNQPRQAQAMAHGVVQFVYGGNGLDVQQQQVTTIAWLGDDPRDVRARLMGEEGASTDWIGVMLQHQAYLCAAFASNHSCDQHVRFPLAFSSQRAFKRLCARGTGSRAPSVAAMGAAIMTHLLLPLRQLRQVVRVDTVSAPPHALDTTHMLPHVCDAMWHLRPWRLVARGVSVADVASVCRALMRQATSACAIDGSSVGLKAVYALCSTSTQAELNKFHHVGEVSTSGMSLLQQVTELVTCRKAGTRAPWTRIVCPPSLGLREAERWCQARARLTLDQLVQPHCEGGSHVLVLPDEGPTMLTTSEVRAWETTWRLHGFVPPPPTDPRVVLRIRLNRDACRQRGVELAFVSEFIRREVWRLGCASVMLAHSMVPGGFAPDVDVPLVVTTLPTDEEWSVMISMFDWTCMANPLGVSIQPSTDDFADDHRGVAAMVVASLALHLHGKLPIRGWASISSAAASLDAATESVRIEVCGAIPPTRLMLLDLHGVACFAQTTWNDTRTVWSTLGVEAARIVWKNEMIRVCGTALSLNHIELLSDMVFYMGEPMSITANRQVSKNGFLHSATYSHTMSMLAQAALCGATDYLDNTMALFVGRAPSMGSNVCEAIAEPGVLDDMKQAHKAVLRRRWRLDRHELVVGSAEDDVDMEQGVLQVGRPGDDILVAGHSEPQAAAPSPWLPAGFASCTTNLVAIESVRMVDAANRNPVPTGLLPQSRGPSDFVFTGSMPGGGGGCVVVPKHPANMEVVRRLSGCEPKQREVEDVGEGLDARVQQQRAEDVLLFHHQSGMSSGITQATKRALSGASINRTAAGSVRLHNNGFRRISAGDRISRRLLDRDRARLDPTMRAAYDEATLRNRKARVAQKARERRLRKKAERHGTTDRWMPHSPVRVQNVAQAPQVQVDAPAAKPTTPVHGTSRFPHGGTWTQSKLESFFQSGGS